MIRLLIIFGFSILSLRPNLAQQTAQFETVFYFEDAIGNKDSVIVGYDTLATRDIDPEFGEEEILSPFDSVFEVRAGHFTWPWREKLSKKIIDRGTLASGPFAPEDCYSGQRIFIYIWAKHQPVKVWWDRTIFLQQRCYRASALLNHWLDELAGPLSPDEIPPEYSCLASEDSAYFDMSEEYLLATPEIARMSLEKEVEGLGLQTIYALRFFPASTPYDYSPCYWVTPIEGAVVPERILLHPNPASSMAYFSLPEGVKVVYWQLYGVSGALLREFKGGRRAEVNLSGLPTGIYHLLLRGNDAKIYQGRITVLR